MIMNDSIESYIKSFSKFENTKNWVSRVVKRNPEILSLFERIRPFSDIPSFSKKETLEEIKYIFNFYS